MVDTIDKISTGHRYAGIAPVVEYEVAQLEKALDNRMLMEVVNGTITPDTALNAWIEKASYRKIVARFKQQVRIGGAQDTTGIEIGGK